MLGVEDAGSYLLHDFRRGHAEDLLNLGASLCVILKAGEWSSAAFAKYLNTSQLEARAVVEAHCASSSSESEGASPYRTVADIAARAFHYDR